MAKKLTTQEKLNAVVEQVLTPAAIKEQLESMAKLGRDGDREASRYLIDRVLGRPKEAVDLTSNGEQVTVEVYIPTRKPRE